MLLGKANTNRTEPNKKIRVWVHNEISANLNPLTFIFFLIINVIQLGEINEL